MLNFSCGFEKNAYLCNPVWDNKEDSLAQLVEHNTFNVGVSGSSPERVTKGSESSDILKRTLSSVGRAADS